MVTISETKACRPCATAKRRCGKQMPHCLRCRKRGIECTYPPTKRTSFVLCGGDDTPPVDHDILPSSTLQWSVYSQGLQSSEVDHSILSLGLNLSAISSDLVDDRLCSSWFTSPETWEIDRSLQVEHNPLSITCLKRLVTDIHRWLTEWVEKGSNPFIHSRLYRTRFPRCVQDAYTALSCYLHKTPSNEQTVFQIIENRAMNLLAEYNVPSADSLLGNTRSSPVTLDPLEHLARVHALLVYQILCLYDGDIRLRHVAESHTPVLNTWKQQMVENASHTACLGASITSSAHEQTAIGFSSPDSARSENLLWHSWILAESIRRTWLVACGIQGTYLIIQKGRVTPCQGGMMFTTRQGVWEAQSALAWEKLCSEVNVGLMQVAVAEKLFTEIASDDVDEFTNLILQAIFGEERTER